MNISTTRSEALPQGPTTGARVVLLVNFVAPNLIAVCQELAKRVARLTILSSVAMESNRNWESDWGDLEVIVQKGWTLTRHPTHPGGYREVNYIHVPTDTLRQLRRLRPDAIVSLELGARTGLSAVYRRMNPRCTHVTAVYASQRSEAGRGVIRHSLRRQLLRWADWVTYNGPSCKNLLLSLGADPARMSPWNYAADPRKPYFGPLLPVGDRNRLKILTVGQLTDRKGMIPATRALAHWAGDHADVTIEWNVVGSGPQELSMRAETLPANLELNLHGHCDPVAIRQHYRDNDLLLFPTKCDEWGLVVDESLFSGLPVIGSCHSQAVTTLIEDGVNGMVYDPEQPTGLSEALDRWTQLSVDTLARMPQAARESASLRTPDTSARQLVGAITMAMAARDGRAVTTSNNPTSSDPPRAHLSLENKSASR